MYFIKVNESFYKRLQDLNEGLHKCDSGWVSVEKDGNKFMTMWTSGKDSHNPH